MCVIIFVRPPLIKVVGSASGSHYLVIYNGDYTHAHIYAILLAPYVSTSLSQLDLGSHRVVSPSLYVWIFLLRQCHRPNPHPQLVKKITKGFLVASLHILNPCLLNLGLII